MRASGILLPITSLQSNYGIGCFSKEAYEFVDKLAAAGQKYWQILPLGPTGYGDSPYQSFSTFAGNPYFIDLEEFITNGLLTKEECDAYPWGEDDNNIDYGLLYQGRYPLLNLAYTRAKESLTDEFILFEQKNAYWLNDYALYMAIKAGFDHVSYTQWEEDIRLRNNEAVEYYYNKYEDEIMFYKFIQFMFEKQWSRLKNYANQRGIKIIGDIPIYVAADSADSWSHPELFQLDQANIPTAVAGCPPDAFSNTGQLWGNPLYDWEYHKNTGYDWWIKRVSFSFLRYDVVRIDHFRGFDEYYAIPYEHNTAEFGCWKKGPGFDIFKVLSERLGNLEIIAEDLGFLTPSVLELVKNTGYPGMKVLQFAFDSREESDYLPHNYDKNCIVYTGTHDNNTLLGWYDEINYEDRQFAREYVNIITDNKEEVANHFIRLALSSVAKLCIIPMQDYLYKDSRARINKPSTLGENWRWRMSKGEFTAERAESIRRLTKLFGRS